jgi:ADP-ribosyl-[dinitrogen reductase] hydrolase
LKDEGPKTEPEGIRGSGYVVDSLEAALWCFERHGSFREAVLAAVNLGEDADTTAAGYGQLAGAHWGAANLPEEWLAALKGRLLIESFAVKLFSRQPRPDPAD